MLSARAIGDGHNRYLVDDGELPCQDPPVVHVRSERLGALIVAHDLSGGCGGHGSHEEGVAYA